MSLCIDKSVQDLYLEVGKVILRNGCTPPEIGESLYDASFKILACLLKMEAELAYHRKEALPW